MRTFCLADSAVHDGKACLLPRYRYWFICYWYNIPASPVLRNAIVDILLFLLCFVIHRCPVVFNCQTLRQRVFFCFLRLSNIRVRSLMMTARQVRWWWWSAKVRWWSVRSSARWDPSTAPERLAATCSLALCTTLTTFSFILAYLLPYHAGSFTYIRCCLCPATVMNEKQFSKHVKVNEEVECV